MNNPGLNLYIKFFEFMEFTKHSVKIGPQAIQIFYLGYKNRYTYDTYYY